MKTKAPYFTPHQYPSPKPEEEVALELERPNQMFTVSVSPDFPSPHLSLAHKYCIASIIICFPAASPTLQTSSCPVHGNSQDAILAQKAQSSPSNLKSLPGSPLENSAILPTTSVHRNCV